MKTPAAPLRRRVLPAVGATALTAAIAAGAWWGIDAISSTPIRRVLFAGDMQRLAPADLAAFAQGVQGASASSASLEAVREAARRIPWVRDASVRRRFPDTVEVRFEAHEPLARWTEGALVSVRGEVFTADHDGALPAFKGPEGSAASMAREYPAIARATAPLAAAISELRLSPRGGWQVVLDSGLALDLGRGDVGARLARFAAAWPQLTAQGVATKRADLRYANGFAVKADPLPGEREKRK